MADGAQTPVPTDGQLTTVRTLAAELVERQQVVDQLTQQLKEAAQRRDDIQNTLLPDAMAEAGLTQFTTTDGYQLQVKPVVAASIPKAKLPAALEWLRKHKHDGLIKTTVKVMFGKGDQARAQQVIKSLQTKGYDFSFDEGVHAQTLTAWVKEQDKAGHSVPDDLLGVYRGRQVKLTHNEKE